MNLRIGRGAWFAGPPMPEFRRGHCVVAVGHKIYVVGGVKSRNDFGGAPAGVTLVYDVWTARWFAAPAPQSLRINAVAAALPDGRILLAGGEDAQGYEQLRSCEIYDPAGRAAADQRWSDAAPMRHLRARAAGAVLDGRVYVVGGSAYGVESPTTEVYDPVADRWDFGPPWGPEPYRADAPKPPPSAGGSTSSRATRATSTRPGLSRLTERGGSRPRRALYTAQTSTSAPRARSR